MVSRPFIYIYRLFGTQKNTLQMDTADHSTSHDSQNICAMLAWTGSLNSLFILGEDE